MYTLLPEWVKGVCGGRNSVFFVRAIVAKFCFSVRTHSVTFKRPQPFRPGGKSGGQLSDFFDQQSEKVKIFTARAFGARTAFAYFTGGRAPRKSIVLSGRFWESLIVACTRSVLRSQTSELFDLVEKTEAGFWCFPSGSCLKYAKFFRSHLRHSRCSSTLVS